MKKHWILALFLTAALLLAGCSSEEPQAGTIVAETRPAVTEAAEAPETEALETQTAETENALSLGQIEGGSYINTYAGFGCDLDEGWVFYSAEELQELPDAVKEAVEGSEVGEAMADIPQIADMMAENAELLASMNVLYSKQDLSSRLTFQILNDEETVDAVLAQKDMMIEAYAQAGMEISSMEKVKVTFLGKEQWAVKSVCKVQGVDLYQVQVLNYRAGSYGVTLTCGTYLEDHTQEVLDLFYPVD